VKGARLLALGGAVALAAGCSRTPPLDPLAERGRQIYLAQCTACHHPSDPAQPGSIGPPIKPTSREVLEAKVLRGSYPVGYTPKRTSHLMQPLLRVILEPASLRSRSHTGSR
jgi:mono/diheme cytochrome c family protein